MKRVLALILVLVMGAFALMSCGENSGDTTGGPEILEELNGKSSDEIFDDIILANSAITNYTMVAKTNIYLGSTFVSDQVDTLKFDGRNQAATIVPSGIVYMEYWWVDDMYYMSQAGQNVKAPFTYEQFLERIGQDPDTPTFLNYPVTWFTDTVIKKDGNIYYLEGSINADEFNEHFGSNMGASIANVSFKVNINEAGEFISLNMEYDQTTAGNTYTCKLVAEFKDIGTTVVTVPANADSFILGVIQ